MADHGMDPAIEVHMDECDHCRKIVAAAFAAKSLAVGTPAPEEGLPPVDVSVSDRYIIAAVLGRGGMGTVYLAHDRTLGRDVALKLHHHTGAERLHREAMAMAKLAHPNVVTVFEVATVDERLYVAMEYVRGETFRGWLATKKRSWREIVAMLCEAGEGLVAAHGAGLVHRDFKPENVLVGDDRRPRVGDFGLARIGPAPKADAINPALADTALTQAGSVLGTPAYMAPEQLAGDTVDARCDQFAFCVVAWEALYGERPFIGIDRATRKEPPRSQVPARVRRVLERGLSIDPAARYADMATLLVALQEPPRTGRKVALALAAAALVAGGGYIAVNHMEETQRAEACDAQGNGVRSLVGAHAQVVMRAKFVATGMPVASDALDHAIKVLGPYADTLAAQSTRTCNATREPTELRAAKRTCLESHTRELAAFVSALQKPDASVVQRAPAAAWSLSEVLPCSDPSTLLARARRTPSKEQAKLDWIKAETDVGHYTEAAAAAKQLVDGARKISDRNTQLDALLAMGHAQMQLEDPAAARAYNEAVALAESLGRDSDAADAYGSLASIAGTLERDYAAAHRYLALSRAKLERLGGKNLVIRGDLFTTEAQILTDENRLGEAEAAGRQAVATLEQALGAHHPKLGSAVGTLSQILLAQTKTDEALAAAARTLAIFEQALGPDHPNSAGASMNYAFALVDAKQFDEARKRLLRADEVFARVFGDVHPMRAAIAGNLGGVEQMQEHWDAALAHYLRAVSILEQTQGPDSADVSGARRDAAKVLALANRGREAEAEQLRALAILDRLGEDGESRLVGALVELAEMQLTRDDKAAAKRTLDRALAIAAKRPADANPAEVDRARELLPYTR